MAWERDPDLGDPRHGVRIERWFVIGAPDNPESYDYRVLVEHAGKTREVARHRGAWGEVAAAYWAAVETARFLKGEVS